jgi:uncharacterized Zn-binding protein involved in type VI secretion
VPGVARVNQDTAGGTITGALVPSVRINSQPVAVIGAAVAPHGDSPHNAATMATGSATVKAGGFKVCRAGDTATCGHAATGSGNVRAG